MHAITRALTLTLAVLFLVPSLGAKPLARKDVPKPLAPWVDWVLKGYEKSQCPFLQGQPGNKVCAWPSRLRLEVGAKSGSFTQQWRAYTETWITLPGDSKRWPQSVKVDGAAAAVVLKDNRPKLRLKKGRHTVTGTLRWDSLPEMLQIPAETGLLSLTVRGKKIIFPVRGPNGRLWVQRARVAAKEKSRLEVVVHRRVVDDIPLILRTRIQLKVSGKNREVVLGRAVPKGFTPMSLTGPLPARIDPDGRLRVQVRAGTWNIQLQARHEGPVASLTLGEPGGPWDADEVWVFESRNQLRLVTVEGPSAVDPQQTELPGDWRNFPAYLMRPGDEMKLVERRRGDSDPAPDRLTLARAYWLDFDGSGMTVQDTMSGTLSRSWRLEMDPRTSLGRVAVGGHDQFITVLKEGGAAGIEVRQGSVNLTADSRIEDRGSSLPAVGWDHDFDSLSATLNLPPGWRLLHARGVDSASPTWVSKWSLLDLFLVLIISLAVGKLWGRSWGLAALATMILGWHEQGAPRWIWLFVLACEALWRALPESRMRTVLRWTRGLSWGVLVLIMVTFFIRQVRHAIYPQLERASHQSSMMRGLAMSSMGDDNSAPASPPAGFKGAASARGSLKASNVPEAVFDEAEMAADKVQMLLNRSGKSKRRRRYMMSQQAQRYAPDPKSRVSTGPGLPNWSWRTVTLSWQGPVKKGAELSLYLLSPACALILTMIRVGLMSVLLLLVFGLPVEEWRRSFITKEGWRKAAAWLFPALLAMILPATAYAGSASSPGFPPKEMLNELRTRLLEAPECGAHCAESPRLKIDASGGGMTIRLQVNVLAKTAVPLPGGAKQWVPTRVLINGVPATGLKRTPDGRLWISLPKGGHQVLMSGPLPDQDTISIPLPLKPRRVEASVIGWVLDGLHEDGLADDSLQLTRVRGAKARSKRSLESGSLPPFVRVDRTLVLGLSWQVHTTVTRLTPVGSPILIEVPLIEGESVMTENARVVDGKVAVTLSPRSKRFSWRSTLKESETILLKAPKSAAWVEQWILNASPVWNVSASGIPTVSSAGRPQTRVRRWRPWPGEEVAITVRRPEGVPGQTLTIDVAQMNVEPGRHATDTSLRLDLRSSRGGEHTLTLPEGADLQKVTIDGRVEPIRQEGRKVTLPIRPGSHSALLEWRQEGGSRLLFKTPVVDAGEKSVNSVIQLHMPRDRWALFVGGPRLGPAVLFWSLLIVFLMVSVGLGRIPLTPLRWRQWFLLSLGLTQGPVLVAGVVALWLILLGWRQKNPQPIRRDFNIIQVVLVIATFAAFVCLFGSITHGLLGLPNMQISGNGSSARLLQWYQDRSGASLPTAWVFSVPLMVYRAAMLCWALWLASSLLEWVKWGWTCFSTDGLWKKAEPKTP